ncbi:MAG: hypothetical protein RLZZ301_101 [Bacteroidota bacterium]|jgi:hypothetical protein
MKQVGTSVTEILANVPAERKEVFAKLHQTILDHLPSGFEAAISYGGLGYVIPHELYPAGYHCKPSEPLPFAGLASQKNSINFYHMGLYADAALHDWFVAEYPNYSTQKLDMGKSCIRFKKLDQIPFELIGQLMEKMSAQDWIDTYERLYKK